METHQPVILLYRPPRHPIAMWSSHAFSLYDAWLSFKQQGGYRGSVVCYVHPLTWQNHKPAPSIYQLQSLKIFPGSGSHKWNAKQQNVFPNYKIKLFVTGKSELWLKLMCCHWIPKPPNCRGWLNKILVLLGK